MSAQIILASASPRRSELLKQIGINHLIHAVTVDETPYPEELPKAYVERVAAEKSAVCLAATAYDLPVLAADTSVICDNLILGKPENFQHAVDILSLLSGRSHQVFSAVSLRGNRHLQALSISQVKFRTLSLAEIIAYCRTGEPFDKAGAYAIQGLASVFVESITGSFSGVMGLPLYETAQLLDREGIKVIA